MMNKNTYITTDNNQIIVDENFYHHFGDIANIPIKNLIKNNNNLIVFPFDINRNEDDIADNVIFELCRSNSDFTLNTYNVMGFIGRNNCDLTINSRFQTNNSDYFLHYMLQRVFCPTLLNLPHKFSHDKVFDFLCYLFVFCLKDAIKQGFYKSYYRKEYNNQNMRGSVQVEKYIRKNIPFLGKISYRIREYTYDNPLNQLIRHTIEFLSKKTLSSQLFNYDLDTKNAINKMREITPSYQERARQSVISSNIKPFIHPYYQKYSFLQNLCLNILNYKKIRYQEGNNEVYGVLFDGAWLWEEYINLLLKTEGYYHPKNKQRDNPVYIFNNNKRACYPDFYKEGIILDAKYKKMKERSVLKDDLYQMISYLYIKKYTKGGFIYPNQMGTYFDHVGDLNGYGGNISTLSLHIPQDTADFSAFKSRIQREEEKLIENIRKFSSL